MPPLKLVTFDVTGTILLFRTPVFEKYVETGLKFGIKADPQVLSNNFKDAWRSLNQEHPNFGKETGLGWQLWWSRIVQKTFTGYVKSGETGKMKEIIDDLIAFHTTKDAFAIRPGTEDLLEYLKSRCLNLGVISNYDPRLHEILDFMDLKKYFDFVLISYEFGHPKPDRRIFDEAVRLANCQSGCEAIHIGDDLERDYFGAKNAGLRAILITSDPDGLRNSRVDKTEVFKDFHETKKYLQSQSRENKKMASAG